MPTKGARSGSIRGSWPSGSGTQARTLYVDEELGLDLTNTVYALDSTTRSLCSLSSLSVGDSCNVKAAVKMHTLLDLRGKHSEFYRHLGWQACTTFMPSIMLLPEAGAIYVVDRGYVDFARLYVLQPGPSSSRVPLSNIDAGRLASAPTDRSTGII